MKNKYCKCDIINCCVSLFRCPTLYSKEGRGVNITIDLIYIILPLSMTYMIAMSYHAKIL